MSDEKQHREVPVELETHSSAEAQAPTPVPMQGSGAEVPQENIVAQPFSVGKEESVFTPNKTGLTTSAIVTPAVLTGQELYKGYNYLTQGMSPNQKYANATIGDRWNIPLKDIQKLTNYPVPLSHARLIQDAAKQITGMPAVPDTFKDIYVMDPRTGHKVLSHTEVTPGSAAIPPMDPERLRPYERTIKNKVIQHGALPVRSGIAAYDVGRAFSPNEDPFARAVDVAGGYSMAASQFLPKKVGKVPVKAIATGLGVVPAAMGVYERGASEHAEGGLAHLAGGGQPEFGEARAYEPSYNERIYDAIAPYIGRDQARGLMGMPGASAESHYNPLSIIAQYPGTVAQDVKDVVGSTRDKDALGAALNTMNLAWDAAPLVGKLATVPARFAKNRAETKAFEDLFNPAVEKIAPYVGKGVKAIKKLLPKGQYEGALAESKLPNYAEGKKVIAKKAARMAMESSDVTPEISGKVAQMLATKEAPMLRPSGEGPLLPKVSNPYIAEYQDVLPQVRLKKPNPESRMSRLEADPRAHEAIQKAIAAGVKIDPKLADWYGTNRLLTGMQNEGRSFEDFSQLMKHMASASQRNPVPQQNKMGSYLAYLENIGEIGEPGTKLALPKGYGSLAQGDIVKRSQQFAAGEYPFDDAIKLGKFYKSYMGYHPNNAVIDVIGTRVPTMATRDPDWLVSRLQVGVDANGNKQIINPKAMYESGELSMEEALKRPGFWEAAPKLTGEYAGLEDMWKAGSKQAGYPQAGSGQALGWYGSAGLEEGAGLKSKPMTWEESLEKNARDRANITGEHPLDVMQKFLKGTGHLKKGGKVKKKK